MVASSAWMFHVGGDKAAPMRGLWGVQSPCDGMGSPRAGAEVKDSPWGRRWDGRGVWRARLSRGGCCTGGQVGHVLG